jgi:hypothetical protein
MMNFPCKDCKHCKAGFIATITGNYEFARCHRDGNYSLDKVSGKRKFGGAFCDIDRKYDHCCGAEAKHFEPKPSKVIQYYDAMQDRGEHKKVVDRMYAHLKELGVNVYDSMDTFRLPDELQYYSISKLRSLYIAGREKETFVYQLVEKKKTAVLDQAKSEVKKDVAALIRKKFKGEKIAMIDPVKLAKEIEDLK